MPPVRRHLPPATRGIVLRSDRRQQHFERRHAERQAERPIPIVGEEPVVAGTEIQSGGHEDGFVPGAADLEERLALVLELNLLVVQLSRQEHETVRREEIIPREAFECAAAHSTGGARLDAIGKG